MVGKEKGEGVMEQEITFCAFCGKELKYDPELFAAGKTGEPVCDECRKIEGDVRSDG